MKFLLSCQPILDYGSICASRKIEPVHGEILIKQHFVSEIGFWLVKENFGDHWGPNIVIIDDKS